jgi:hypothetical protein
LGNQQRSALKGERSETIRQKHMKTYFYYLKDPKDNAIRYIGQSKNPKERLSKHIHDSKRGRDKNTRKVRWILSLLRENLKPILEVFETHLGSIDAAHIREWQLIKQHLAQGHDLTNGNDGGVPYILSDERVKKVYQYDKQTGIFLKMYRCAFDAYSETSIKDAGISLACKNEGIKPRFPGGFIWSYNEYTVYPLEIIPISKTGGKKSIYVCGNGISKIYTSARIAAAELNIDYRQISACAKGKQKTVKGYTITFVL